MAEINDLFKKELQEIRNESVEKTLNRKKVKNNRILSLAEVEKIRDLPEPKRVHLMKIGRMPIKIHRMQVSAKFKKAGKKAKTAKKKTTVADLLWKKSK